MKGVSSVKCPRCGRELRASKKDPAFALCDTCRKKYRITKSEQVIAEKKPRKSKKKTYIIIAGVVLAIMVISGLSYEEPEKPAAEAPAAEENTEKDPAESADYEKQLQNQRRALEDLIDKYEKGEESAYTTSERLKSLSGGIDNTIAALQAEAGNDDLISYATALKGIAGHYSEYLTSGDKAEMDDVEALWKTIE